MKKKTRVLFVGHDNLLEHEEGLEVDFFGGLSRGMGQSKPEFRQSSFKQYLAAFFRLLMRRYQQVVFPSALLTRAAELGESGFKRHLANFLYRGSYSPWITSVVRRLTSFFLRGRPVGFVERFSQSGVHRQLFQFFDKAVVFKTIAHREYEERDGTRIVPTHYWINIDCYPKSDLVEFEKRKRDVFYVGSLAFRARQVAPELEVNARERGVDFYWERERLDFEDYVERLNQCRIAWSPEGSNWQCWRHYEALYYGAIPLINRPDQRIFHTLVEGETCFFYDSVEEAAELMKEICQSGLRLKLNAEERRKFVVEHHSEYAVGRILRQELGI